MLVRRLLAVVALAVVVVAAPGWAGPTGDRIEVVAVTGPLDSRLVAFVEDAITGSDAALVVLRIDSPAALDDSVGDLIDLVADPPVPVAVWVGPEPAGASGAAVRLLAVAQIQGAAPGVVLGPAAPTLAGATDDGDAIASAHPDLPAEVIDGRVVVAGPIPGLVTEVQPSIGQFVVALDGREVTAGGVTVTLDTALQEEVDGVMVTKPSGTTAFVEPGLIDRTLRLTISPGAAFFFLVLGLTLIVFEFYAAGPGLAAASGAIALLLAGYGLASMPIRWWALLLTLAGIALYTADFQRNDLGWRSFLGTGGLIAGGLLLVDGGDQLPTSWWVVLVVVAFAALFFGFGLTTVVRARFSTQTIGRDHLIGRRGTAETDVAPDGIVLVDGARWGARATRASGIGPGDAVTVVAVDGVMLEVEPVP
jgi:membrane-bound serine protease (ClpP class)